MEDGNRVKRFEKLGRMGGEGEDIDVKWVWMNAVRFPFSVRLRGAADGQAGLSS